MLSTSTLLPRNGTRARGRGPPVSRETIKCVFSYSSQTFFFKGHTSIPWIQISMEKAYQSNFAEEPVSQPSRQATQTACGKAVCVKGYFTP